MRVMLSPAGRRLCTLLMGWILLFAVRLPAPAAISVQTDVCVYGGTSGGVVAAVTAAKLGKSVVLVHYNNHIGGMTSAGLGVTDVGQAGSIGGLAREFYRRVGLYYGSSSPFFWFEPKAAESIFRQMLSAAGVVVYTNQPISGVTMTGKRIAEMQCLGDYRFRARMFIDTTYEGDLLAAAGVSFTVGREGTATYGESLAGVRIPGGSYDYDPYQVDGNPGSGLLSLMQPNSLGPVGSGDHRVQAYNFRLCFSQNPNNRISLTSNAPPNYAESNYELVARYIESRLFTDGTVSLGQLLHIQQLIPNGKTDINANGELSTDFVGASYAWATNSHAGREAMRQDHEDYTRGLFYFLGNSPRVPAGVRTEMQSWGLAKDEFADLGGWPHQIYVREGRRMMGDYVMRQQNCQGLETAPDSIGLASYAMDSHAVSRVPVNGLARSEGGFFVAVPQPFPISYRSIVPKINECENVLVTFALSASHVAFASCRMEPVFMMTSQSAATAAAFSIDDGVPVQDVSYPKLAAQLRADEQLLNWVGGTLTTNGVILDNGNPGVSQVGSWTTGANAGYWGTSYLHDQNSGKGSKYVRFTPNLPGSGEYDVFIWYVAASNRDTAVPCDIVHATGTTRVYVDQTISGSQWVFLMRTNFFAGWGGGVIIRNDGTSGFVVADAVRFMPVGLFDVPKPTVEVIAGDPWADERGTNRGSFTFVRTGDLSGRLGINYALSGSAIFNQDYTATSTNLTFPSQRAGEVFAMVPIVDALSEDDETITMTLMPSTNYVIGPMNSATIRIRDGNSLPPRIDAIWIDAAGRSVLEFFAAANRSYAVEATAELFPSEWHEVGVVGPQLEGRPVAVTNGPVLGVAERFFRVKTP
jgi:hypothetical protein